MTIYEKLLMKLKKLTLLSAGIVVLIIMYRCRDIVPYTYRWLTHTPKVYMGNMEPRFPSWFTVNFGGLLGPDENSNGIRDDVEIIMNEKFKDYGNNEKAILYNFAIRKQNSLKYTVGHNYRVEYWKGEDNTFLCRVLLSDFLHGRKSNKWRTFLINELKFISDLIFNTYERFVKHDRYSAQFSGWSTGETNSQIKFNLYLELEKKCNFSNKDSLPIQENFLRINSSNIALRKRLRRLIVEYEKEYGNSKQYLYKHLVK
jgi:hypothetical protein